MKLTCLLHDIILLSNYNVHSGTKPFIIISEFRAFSLILFHNLENWKDFLSSSFKSTYTIEFINYPRSIRYVIEKFVWCICKTLKKNAVNTCFVSRQKNYPGAFNEYTQIQFFFVGNLVIRATKVEIAS